MSCKAISRNNRLKMNLNALELEMLKIISIDGCSLRIANHASQ